MIQAPRTAHAIFFALSYLRRGHLDVSLGEIKARLARGNHRYYQSHMNLMNRSGYYH